jgi:hypothetical protein
MVRTYDNDIKQDFDWIFRILKSCKTKTHFEVTDSCFNLCMKKWDHLSNDRIYQYILSCFKSRYEHYKNKKKLLDEWSTNVSK